MELIIEFFAEILLRGTGVFIWWNIKGRKGEFKDFKGHSDTRDMFTGIAFWSLVIFLIMKFI